MWEKLNYNNWVTEELKVKDIKLENENTKNDLYTLRMLMKLNWEGFSYKDISELNKKYFNEMAPIISALDYDWISWEEAFEMVDKLENIREIDKVLIKFLLSVYYEVK